MSQDGYRTMGNVPAFAGGMQTRRENFGMRHQTPGAAGGVLEQSCHFPAPLPHRVYCEPAAFHRVNGQEYHNLTVAYGASRPYTL